MTDSDRDYGILTGAAKEHEGHEDKEELCSGFHYA